VLCGAVVAGVGVHCCNILVTDELQSTIKSHTVHVMLYGALVVDAGVYCGGWCSWVFLGNRFVVLCKTSGCCVCRRVTSKMMLCL
jgi:hypothetical protein